MGKRSLTVEVYEKALLKHCLAVHRQVARKVKKLRKLEITWPDATFWCCAYNLQWMANESEQSDDDESLDLPKLPLSELKALRKRYTKAGLAGFFLGSEGQDTLNADTSSFDYEPSEYNQWVMGIFHEVIPRVEAQLRKQPELKGCKIELHEHDGGADYSLASHLEDVADLRLQHGYHPTRELLTDVLGLFTNDEKKIERWLKASPKPVKASAATKKKAEPVAEEDEPAAAIDEEDPDAAIEALGQTRPITPEIREKLIRASQVKDPTDATAAWWAMMSSEDPELLGAIVRDVETSTGARRSMLLAQVGRAPEELAPVSDDLAPALVRIIEHDKEEVPRILACQALSALENMRAITAAIPVLTAFARDCPRARDEVAGALMGCHDPRATALLETFAKDPDKRIASVAKNVLAANKMK